jgi:hypothetical protein
MQVLQTCRRLRIGAVAVGAASGAAAAALHGSSLSSSAPARASPRPAYSASPPRLRTLGEKQPAVTVERVVVLTRHGDRTPAAWATGEQIGTKIVADEEAQFWSLNNRAIIPSSDQITAWSLYAPWEESNAPSVTGTLTLLGAATQHANGLWLRERYIDQLKLLPARLNSADVTARSTPFPRCVQSCQKLLLGLYPPTSRPPPGSPGCSTPIITNKRGVEPMCEYFLRGPAPVSRKWQTAWSQLRAGARLQLRCCSYAVPLLPCLRKLQMVPGLRQPRAVHA